MKYRLPLITEKSAIILIISNTFAVLSYATCLTQTDATWNEERILVYTIVLAMYPIVGLVSDCWLGRYKVLSASMCLLSVAVLLKALEELVFEKSQILTYCSATFLGLTGACYFACVLQFTTDQLVGASGEQLSFTIYWLIWGCINGPLVANLVMFLPDEARKYLLLGISILSLTIAIFVMKYWSHLLMTKPLLSNPIKHIAKVLNYARKHKYPERRSALTYWEEDYPSRIDLGKDKYGGPFTVEQVEDVKTVLRLIPLLIMGSAYVIPATGVYSLSTSVDLFIQFVSLEGNIYVIGIGLLSTLGLPTYHFLVYPVFYNSIPSMLRRIGLGFFLMMLSILSSSVIELLRVS